MYMWVRIGWVVGVRVCVRCDGRGGGGGAAIATSVMSRFGERLPTQGDRKVVARRGPSPPPPPPSAMPLNQKHRV